MCGVRFGLASALICWGLVASSGFAQQLFPNVLDAVPPIASKSAEANPLMAPLPGTPAPIPPETLLPDTGYLQVNPNGRTSLCSDDNSQSRRLWVTGSYLFGVTTDLGPVDRKTMQGARAGGGLWFDDYRTLGVELSFLTVHDTYGEFVPTALGTALVNAPVTYMTTDLNLRGHLFTHDRYRVDGLVGYRMLNMSEQYNSFGAGAPLSTKSTNVVHAFQLGFVGNYHFGPYFGELAVKLGVGQNAQRTTVNSITVRDTKIVAIPEVNWRVGYTLGSGTRLFVGYNMLYLSNAARPNNFGPPDFLLHAVQGGLEFSF